MKQKRLRSSGSAWLSLALALVTVPLDAQIPERPHAHLDRLPVLDREVWPADFNGDGRTDLVAGRRLGGLVIAFGSGGGGFAPNQLIDASLQHPVGVGDLNGDGHIDIIANDGTSSFVLAGGGDGTFAAPAPTGFALHEPVYVRDMNNDALPDLVGFGPFDSVSVHPGHGDLSFGTPTHLPMGIMAQDFSLADLNGDGLLDVAGISQANGASIDVFLNLGSFVFSGSRFALEGNRRGLGITAHDLDADGAQDLIATTATLVGSVAPFWSDGFVNVFLGDGTGTFGSPLVFATNRGPHTVAVGDFNGDARLDVATGNQSFGRDCEAFNHLWDSVSMLPGFGDGQLGPAASYALGNSEEQPDILQYRRRHHRLHAQDLNGDGRTDLVASPGAVLLGMPAAANQPPVVDAGPDAVIPLDSFTRLNGSAVDPDNDWLTFTWTDANGRVVGDVPHACPGPYSGTNTFTLTVTDGRGGIGIDTVTITSPGEGLPGGWSGRDVGDTSVQGSSSVEEGVYTLMASGADVWGTTDEFHYARLLWDGDFALTARVLGVENTHPWAKAGLMIRESVTDSARHAFLFATPEATSGIAFQRRPSAGGSTIHTSGPAVAPPAWLRLLREGDVISAFWRPSENDPWTLIDRQTLAGLPSGIWLGLALTSHVDGTLATARFDNVNIVPLDAGLPEGWNSTDVGTPGAEGSSSFTGSGYAVAGSGADIWGTQDAFRYQYLPLPGDGELVARVTSLTAADEWSKAGVMIRQSLDPAAAHHFLLASGSRGLAHQWRPAAGDATLHTGFGALPLPAWFRIRREGALVELSYSRDGASWGQVAVQPFPEGDALIGLAVTSHVFGVLATAEFDNVEFRPGFSDPWIDEDIGATGLPGGATLDDGVHTVTGSGADIWGTSDAFHYTYQHLAGDGSITARIDHLQAVHPWTKAGVMIRGQQSSSSSHAFMLLSRDHGLAFQRRTSSGSLTTHTGGGPGVAPNWVRLTRSGATVTASTSVDGHTWTTVGSDLFPEFSEQTVLVGLAVTSHDNSAPAAATFSEVQIER